MTRSSFKNLWLMVIVVVLVLAFYCFNKGNEFLVETNRAKGLKATLTTKLKAGSKVNAALKVLDDSTINQNISTKLDVLRYMGLEDADVRVEESAEVKRRVAGADLFVRRVAIKPNSQQTYSEALRLVDWMHNSKKIIINSVTLKPGQGFGDSTDVMIRGTLYGMSKR